MPNSIEQRIMHLWQGLLTCHASTELCDELEHLSVEIAQLIRERDIYKTAVPPGHFYSPIPSLEEVQMDEDSIFNLDREIIGIDLNQAGQLELLKQLKVYYAELPFPEQKGDLRYFYDNPFYSYSDAIFLYSILRHLNPRHYIEIGSGFSSLVTLDTNELFMENRISCTFIEPNPERLLSELRSGDCDRIEIIPCRLQDVPVSKFSELVEGDILFIDSTHVAKVGSDVNYIFSDILPQLNSGVYIHFHDVFYPFEYPKEWIYSGVAWNEIYMLRAFLKYNYAFQIVMFNTFLEHVYPHKVYAEMPLCMKNPGGSIWLRKQ